jgi:hypothetical protein
MFKDMAYSRALVTLASSWLYPDGHTGELVEKLWEWQEECLARYGNEGYDIAKSTEGLSKAYLSRVADDAMAGPGDGYDQMMDKVRKKERKLGSTTLFQTDRFHRILTLTRTTQEVVELFGIQKCCGHPTIDPKKGGLSAAEEARSPDPTLWIDAEDTRACFAGVYTEGFIARNHRWPTFRRPPALGTRLGELWKSSSLHFKRQTVPLTDWRGVRFAQEHEFDTFPNYLDLMDDKALSFYWSDRACQWEQADAKSQRRVLLEMLSRHKVDPAQVFQTVENGNIPDEWKVVTLYPKEREFKLAARMFSMMVFEMRLFYTMHEANLSDSILPYVPQLTMTDSSKDIQLRFLSMTGEPRHGTLPLFVELDLSRWNLRWRALAVERIGRDLNDLFGTRRVYTTGHKFFEEARIMVRVAGLPPDGVSDEFPPESDLLWRNHKGGFEGIIQKLWSLATVAMIDRALRQLEISYTLTIQGDNVVVSAHVPRIAGKTVAESLKYWADIITERAARTASSVNQDLKPEECVASSTVVTYSKNVYVAGAELYTSLKFNSRLFPTSSEDFPSVPAFLGSVFSGAVAAAERCKQPLVCLWLAYYSAALYLIRGSECMGHFSTHISLDPIWKEPSFLRYCLTLPSELGGYPVLGLSHFMYKSSGDPTSKSLGSVWLCRDEGWAKEIIQETYGEGFFNDAPEVSSILQDPYGLPLRKPTSPADAVAEGTKAAILSFAINHDVVELVGSTVTGFKDNLVENLSRVTPFNPVILRDILDCSIAGVQDTISRMFISTRSIQAVSRRQSGVDLVSLVLRAGGHQLEYLSTRWRSRTWGQLPANLTLYTWVIWCRGQWSKAGVEPVGISSHLPCDFTPDFGFPPSKNGIRVVGLYSVGDCLTERGPEVPYLGTPTREKRSEHGFKLVGSSLSSVALRKLQLILSQTSGQPGMKDLLRDVGLTRSNLDLTEVTHLLPRVIGGNPFHRYDARTGYRGAQLLGNANFASWTYLNSNHASPLSGSVADFPIMVQEFYLFLLFLLESRYRYSSEVRKKGADSITLLIHPGTLDPLPSGLLSLLNYNPVPNARYPTNPLAFVRNQEVKQVSGPGEVTRLVYMRHALSGDWATQCSALESVMVSALRGARVGIATADPRYHTMSIPLDLLEIVGYGLDTVIARFGCLVADVAIQTAWSTGKNRTHLPTLGIIAAQMAPVLARSLSKHIHNPLLSEDPGLMRYRLHPGPGYHTTFDVTAKISTALTRRAAGLLEDTSGMYYTRGVVIFDSDPPTTVLRAHTVLLYRALHRGYMLGLLSVDVVRYWLKEYIRMYPRSTPTAPRRDITAKLDIVLWTLHDKAVGQQSDPVATAFRDVAKGKGLFRCESAAIEVVRSVRLRALEVEAHQRARGRDRGPLVSDVITADPIMVSLDVDSRVYPYPSLRLMEAPRRFFRDVDLHVGEDVLYGSSAFAVWLKVVPYLPRTTSLVVGSGLGGAACALLLAGSQFVTGLDLTKDIPGEYVTGTPYCPPLVSEFRLSNGYHQAVETWTRGGDWEDQTLRSALLAELPPGSLLVVDVHSHSRCPLAYLDGPVLSRRNDLTVALRIMGLVADIDLRILALSCVWSGISTLVVRSWEDWRDVILICTGVGVLNSYPLARGMVYGKTHVDPLASAISAVISGRESLMDILLLPMGGQTDPNEVVACESYLDACKGISESRGTYTSYHEWGRISEGALGCLWLLRPEQRETINRNLSEGFDTQWTWKGWAGVTMFTNSSKKLITHVAARLCPLKKG